MYGAAWLPSGAAFHRNPRTPFASHPARMRLSALGHMSPPPVVGHEMSVAHSHFGTVMSVEVGVLAVSGHV